MKLNQECLRDCLIHLEEKLTFGDRFDVLAAEIKQHSPEDILYSFLKLREAGFITGKPTYADNQIVFFPVNDITYVGHEFLAKIHSDTIWKKTTEIAKNLGGVSVHFLGEIASQVLSQLILAALNSPKTTNLPL